MVGLSSLGASLLLLALCAYHVVPAGSVIVPSTCCFSFIPKIPHSQVVGYHLVSRSVCPKEGVIFTTRRGQKRCADPKLLWVQKYMKRLDEQKQKKAAVRTRPKGTRVPARRRPAKSTAV